MPRRSAGGGAAPTAGAQGTLGGMAQSVGARPGRRPMPQLDDATYLWILVFLEVGFIAYFRSAMSRFHGG